MGNGHGCYVGHSYVTTFRSKRSGCHKSNSPVHHREVLDKRSIPDLNHSSALCAASYCHLRWSCARHVIRYACRVFLVGRHQPGFLPEGLPSRPFATSYAAYRNFAARSTVRLPSVRAARPSRFFRLELGIIVHNLAH